MADEEQVAEEQEEAEEAERPGLVCDCRECKGEHAHPHKRAAKKA